MQGVWDDHESQRVVLPLCELRRYERVFVDGPSMYQVADLAKAEVLEVSRARIGGLRWLPSLTSVAFLLPLFLLYWQVGGPSAPLADPDTGLHIRTGDWIVAHHEVPRHDLYSFTIPGKPWCD